MLKVLSNGEIQLTRGDTARFTVNLDNEVTKEPYEVQSDDVVTFTVKNEYEDETPLIEKKVIGSANIHIKPEDTKGLAFGKYKYDVQVTTADGDNYTPIADKVFNITKEVGR